MICFRIPEARVYSLVTLLKVLFDLFSVRQGIGHRIGVSMYLIWERKFEVAGHSTRLFVSEIKTYYVVWIVIARARAA